MRAAPLRYDAAADYFALMATLLCHAVDGHYARC